MPLATIQAAVFEFLRERDDVVLFGAQAVNAYVDEPRMTQAIDLMSVRAEELVEELRDRYFKTAIARKISSQIFGLQVAR